MEVDTENAQPSPSEILYDRCNKDAGNSQEKFKKIFAQDDLISLCSTPPLDHITNIQKLMPIIQELVHSMFFITVKTQSGTCWGLRPRDAATKVKKLGRDEKMVYQAVEDAHELGIWQRNIKKRTQIMDNRSMDKICQKLERMNLIKNIKTARAPTQKTYILYHLAASEEVTGGSFYDGGDLDESLVEELSNLIVFHVRQMSWVDERKKRVKRESSPVLIRDEGEPAAAGATDSHAKKKRKRSDKAPSTTQSKDIEDSGAPTKKHRTSTHEPPTTSNEPSHTQLAFTAGHEYPTASSIHTFITTSNIIRAIKSASLTVSEIETILNLLVWDEKLEEIYRPGYEKPGYRTVRGVKFRYPGDEEEEEGEEERKRGNGLTEMPCGRCPVIDLCGTGRLINAETCVYFERWLDRDVAAA